MSAAMTEETLPAKKKAPKKTRTAPAPPPVSGGGEGGLTSPRTWAVLGAVLVGGIIFWRLVGSSYTKDVETICNAEKGSGSSVEHEQSKVTAWIRANLGTPEGNQLYSAIADAKLSERAKKVQDAADQAHVSPCPIVTSYQQMYAQGEARADVQRLCSDLTFPKLLAADDAGRLDMIEKWIDASAQSPKTKELGAALQQAATPADRAKLLSDTASKYDMFSCANAKTLETPTPPAPTGVAVVRLFADPQVTGGGPDADAKKAFAAVQPDLLACYTDGITRRPDLAGKIMMKMEFDNTGKVVLAKPAEGGNLADALTGKCIIDKLHKMKMSVAGPMATTLLPIELTHE
jgi:hypothetical protein